MKKLFCICIATISLTLKGEGQVFEITLLPEMPEPVANNAVVSAYCGDSLCVYSFCGIDETKTPQGIHLKAWRYNTISEVWTALPSVPDDTGNGKIAAGASVINNKIYLVGGYYVEDNFSELSSDDIHIFNPETNEWEDNGAPIPVPIDDHVQCTYQDSLIYVITGWSDTGNVSDVQIYNPALDQWTEGTPASGPGYLRVFGGSGDIIGNQIIYHGGVRVSNQFLPTDEVRVGIINPENPEEIEWDGIGESDFGTLYRAASLAIPSANAVFWFGGSHLGYNFDGIDYNGTGGVAPTDMIIGHNIYDSDLMFEAVVSNSTEYPIPMDLRGIAELTTPEQAQLGIHQSIICGGMLEDQEVSDKCFLLTGSDLLSADENQVDKKLKVWTYNDDLNVACPFSKGELQILDLNGKEIFNQQLTHNQLILDISQFVTGVYIVTVQNDSEVLTGKLIIGN